MIELTIMVLLLRVMKSKGKEKVRVSGAKEEEQKKERKGKEVSGREMKLEASLYTQKGNDIYEISILPLCSITGYYTNTPNYIHLNLIQS